MKSPQGFVWLPLLLATLVGFVISGGAYVYLHPNALPAASQEAAALTEAQIQSVLGLLTAFNVPQATITNVNGILHNKSTPPVNTPTIATTSSTLAPHSGTTTNSSAAPQTSLPSQPQPVSSPAAASPGTLPCTLNTALLDNCVLQ